VHIQLIPRHPSFTRGATLLEVMVALVIMAVGLLGLAGLQMTGLTTNGNAEKRTQATIVANDMIERMRANATGVGAGNYAAVNYAAIDCNTPPAPYCQDHGGTAAGSCNTGQIASFDAFIGVCDARTRLPSGSMSIACTNNTGTAEACTTTNFRTITVNWTSQEEDNAAANKSLSVICRIVS